MAPSRVWPRVVLRIPFPAFRCSVDVRRSATAILTTPVMSVWGIRRRGRRWRRSSLDICTDQVPQLFVRFGDDLRPSVATVGRAVEADNTCRRGDA